VVTLIPIALALAFGYILTAATIPILLVLIGNVAMRLDRVRKGRRGEREVTGLLRRLPDDYFLVNDVMIAGAGGNVDHVVVGPCGVLVIETKRLAGKIRCYRDDWYVNGYRRRSVSRQVKRQAAALREFLAARHADVRGEFIRAITVFTHPRCRLVEIDRAQVTVARYSELLQVVLDIGQQRRMAPMLAKRLAGIVAGSQA
jgi:hypothetical protein